MDNNEIRIDERYVSFVNIDCFENACQVIDCLLRVLQRMQQPNLYWERFIPKIPKAYHARDINTDKKEELLYLVCSNVFYLEELFENEEDQIGLQLLRRCELECC